MSKPFPMPNDKLSRFTVVASVYYSDDIATVLLLAAGTPYFHVAHYYLEDVPAEYDVPDRPAGFLHFVGVEENIVPAVELYVEYGGDY